jgi:hypothetical protein
MKSNKNDIQKNFGYHHRLQAVFMITMYGFTLKENSSQSELKNLGRMKIIKNNILVSRD